MIEGKQSESNSRNHEYNSVIDKPDEPSDKDITEESEYLPFSSVTIHDTTQNEDADIENQLIPTVTGNISYPWSENSNLTPLNSQNVDWEEDGNLSKVWNNSTVGWSDSLNIPNGLSVNEKSNNIEVILGNRRRGLKNYDALPEGQRKKTNNITVKTDNKELLDNELPTIFGVFRIGHFRFVRLVQTW